MVLTAEELIALSITHNTPSHATYTPELAGALLVLSDDSVDSATEIEYWGTDDDGHAWCVHLRGARK